MERFWYKNAIIYGVDVGLFQDSNGDGVGDFRGLTERLDYLAELGVTCLWVLPFYPTPDCDNGYDIANYYAVNPRCGTLEDFMAFLHQAGERGIRVLLDLVMNHTSDEHPWFQAARRDPTSRFREYYVWTDSPPPTPHDRGNILGESTVWTYDEVAGAYYYHRFYHFEPELQLANPEVREEIARALDFWLSFPIAGFRVDAASHMIAAKGLERTQPADPHGILKELRSFVSRRREGAVLLGEADVAPSRLTDFFGDGDELHMLFNFLLSSYCFLALARKEAGPIARCLAILPASPQEGQWANFLRNLDEADLEQLADEERQEIFRALAPQPEMQIYGRGVRRRLAPMLQDRRRLEMAWSLLFSLPGSPVMVYGDEIGMGDDLSLPGRNAVRTPMQWSNKRNAGFSEIASNRLYRPLISKGDYAYRDVNVADQHENPDSLLNWMKQLIHTRRNSPQCGLGTCDVLQADHPAVFAHRCKYQRDAVIAIHNLCDQACDAQLMLENEERQLERVFGNATVEVVDAGTISVRLPEYGYGWFFLHGT